MSLEKKVGKTFGQKVRSLIAPLALGAATLAAPQKANADVMWNWNNTSANNNSIVTLSAENNNNGAVYNSYTWNLMDFVFTPIYNANLRMQNAYGSAQEMAESETSVALLDAPDSEVFLNWNLSLQPSGSALSTHGPGNIDDNYHGWYSDSAQNQQAIQLALSANMLDTTGDGIKDLNYGQNILQNPNQQVLLGEGYDSGNSIIAQDFGDSINVAPEPHTLAFLVMGGEMIISVQGCLLGSTNGIQLGTEVGWSDEVLFVATGLVQSVTVPATNATGWYRLRATR